ncbi:MAG: glutamate--tRNA ligase [bacterium]|nr:glutamate--tRNA ligase [bacterium]
MSNQIRVRIAPSPTGYLHIGTARTALFNYLFAKRNNGKFILRIEDTDLERSTKYYEDDILDSLKWLGLEWDEFYKQSDRLPIYTKYVKQLLDNGKAFWCYHTKEELANEQQEQMAGKQPPRHLCSYKGENHKSPAYAEASAGRQETGSKGIIRLKVDENSERKIKFRDIIRGDIEFEEKLLGDLSIAKDESTPLYNFAVVVDDYENNISHIIRGEDHIANTPKQILIQEALGFDMPQYAHLPLILGQDRSKMSKRHGATAVVEYSKLGYLPQSMVNFMAMLGFTPPDDRQILSLDELIEIFDLEKVHKGGAVFDIKKLDWLNGEYIKRLSDDELEKALLSGIHHNYQLTEVMGKPFLNMVRERIKKISDIKEFEFFLDGPNEYEKGLLKWKERTDEEVTGSLSKVRDIIEKIGTDDKDKLRAELDVLGKELEDRGLVYWPLRVALSGMKASPDPVDIANILGKEKTLEHIRGGIEKLG